jgi:hypothetical protein
VHGATILHCYGFLLQLGVHVEALEPGTSCLHGFMLRFLSMNMSYEGKAMEMCDPFYIEDLGSGMHGKEGKKES